MLNDPWTAKSYTSIPLQFVVRISTTKFQKSCVNWGQHILPAYKLYAGYCCQFNIEKHRPLFLLRIVYESDYYKSASQNEYSLIYRVFKRPAAALETATAWIERPLTIKH